MLPKRTDIRGAISKIYLPYRAGRKWANVWAESLQIKGSSKLIKTVLEDTFKSI